MEYHEIGEIFEHDGVKLEVQDVSNIYQDSLPINFCAMCYFGNMSCDDDDSMCNRFDRADGKEVVYKLIEQCKSNGGNNKEEINNNELLKK